MIGQRFGKLTVERFAGVRLVGSKKKRRRIWECRCDCGKSHTATTNNLNSGNTTNCGCVRADRIRSLGLLKRTHGMSKHPIHRIHSAMMQRCYNPDNDNYPGYGGRGIGVCDEWRIDRTTFFAWALAGGYRPALTIDRIDNDANYKPDNCRWLTPSEHAQIGEKRHHRKLTWNGETHTVAVWERMLGLRPGRLHDRIVKRGWPIEKAFTQPSRQT